MVFPVVGGNESKGYDIENSLRFNQGDTAHLDKTFGSAGTSNKTGTLSFWYKRTTVDNVDFLFHVYPNRSGHSNDRTFIAIGSDNKLVYERIFEGSTQSQLKTTQLFRDVSAWYHIVVVFDTTQGTDTNRLKVYVNGNQVTSFSTTNYPGQNVDIDLADAHMHTVGAGYSEGSYVHPLDGYLTEYHYIDGTAKAQTDFGEFNDNGVWVPIKYTGTYGTNGFYLEFQQTGTSANSSGIGADTSGNDNHFTPTNLAATDITEDTCTNNFCTMNPLAIGADATLSEGNCQIAYGSGTRSVSTANMGFASGKWYWEWKISAASTDGCSAMPGIGGLPFGPDLGTYLGNNSNGYAYNGEDGKKYSGGANSAYGDTFTTNDIISVAFDADNGNLYFYKNGTIQNSGTAAYTSLTSPSSGFYYPAMGDASGAKTFTAQANFGNPPYSISSGNSDGKYGNFEYAPPSGYYAICTKRLAEFG
jgi:hypothetical protein